MLEPLPAQAHGDTGARCFTASDAVSGDHEVTLLERLKLAAQIVKTGADAAKFFPPMVICPVCSRQLRWIEQGARYGCAAGHQFTLTARHNAPSQRLPNEGEHRGPI
ncbi:MAG: hypothetical protein H0X04_02685 [Chthoniobacterales bacterium]|nr:hypothetical protein [Chthoniobacterales bacterium]